MLTDGISIPHIPMAVADQDLTCRECEGSFIFTIGEQRFFEEQSFQPPVRCKDCRDAKKKRFDEQRKST